MDNRTVSKPLKSGAGCGARTHGLLITKRGDETTTSTCIATHSGGELRYKNWPYSSSSGPLFPQFQDAFAADAGTVARREGA